MTGGADDIADLFIKLEGRIDPKYWKPYLRPLKRIKKNIKYAL